MKALVTIGGIGVVVIVTMSAVAISANATDLIYNLQSPNFGGANGIALSMAQQQKSLKAANAQAKAAAAAALSKGTPASQATAQNQAFINAIISQLTGLVAYKVASGIANSTSGQAGTVQSGDTTISFINNNGNLSVTLTSPSGTTTLTVPTGF